MLSFLPISLDIRSSLLVPNRVIQAQQALFNSPMKM
jgi:hypothetical protein